MLRAQKVSHMPTLGPRYMLYGYMDPLAMCQKLRVEGLGFSVVLGLGLLPQWNMKWKLRLYRAWDLRPATSPIATLQASL